jgi:hypothetical protein
MVDCYFKNNIFYFAGLLDSFFLAGQLAAALSLRLLECRNSGCSSFWTSVPHARGKDSEKINLIEISTICTTWIHIYVCTCVYRDIYVYIYNRKIDGKPFFINKDGASQSGARLSERIQEPRGGSPSCSGPLVAATGCNSLVSPCRKALANEELSWMRSGSKTNR